MPNVKLRQTPIDVNKKLELQEYNRIYYKKIGILKKYNKQVKPAIIPKENKQETIIKKVDKITVFF